MFKRFIALFLCMLLLPAIPALGEDDLYLRVISALYAIVRQDDTGIVPLGSGVLFQEQNMLLTTADCAVPGELYAIGADGEYPIRGWEIAEGGQLALMELAMPATAAPLPLGDYTQPLLPYLFGVNSLGESSAVPLYQMRYALYGDDSALHLQGEEGLMTGAYAVDENGAVSGVVVAQQGEGLGSYIALDPDALWQMLARDGTDFFLKPTVVWENGFLNIQWQDQQRENGCYIINLSGWDNVYYTSYEAELTDRRLDLSVPTGHTYGVYVQWVPQGDAEKDITLGICAEYTVPDPVLNGLPVRVSGHVSQLPRGQEPRDVLPEMSLITTDALSDPEKDTYLQLHMSYQTDRSADFPMTVELIAPDGQFYFEEMSLTIDPAYQEDHNAVVILNDLWADCRMFSESEELQPGAYRLRMFLAGHPVGDFPFTVAPAGTVPQAPGTPTPAATAQPSPTPVEDATSGLLHDVQVRCEEGAIYADWTHCAVPEGAQVSLCYLYEGNPFVSVFQVKEGHTQMDFPCIPDRSCVLWVAWTTQEGRQPPLPEVPSQYRMLDAQTVPSLTVHDFTHVRSSLTLTDGADPEGDGVYLPEAPITREGLMDAGLKLVFQTEDRYRVTEASMDHSACFVFYTPEGYAFFEPGGYSFHPEMQGSDLWVKDLTPMLTEYMQYAGPKALPAGTYRLAYYVDGCLAADATFALE